MCDQYYKDAKASVDKLSELDTSMFSDEVISVIDNAIQESTYLLDEYENRYFLIDGLEDLLCQNDIEHNL